MWKPCRCWSEICVLSCIFNPHHIRLLRWQLWTLVCLIWSALLCRWSQSATCCQECEYDVTLLLPFLVQFEWCYYLSSFLRCVSPRGWERNSTNAYHVLSVLIHISLTQTHDTTNSIEPIWTMLVSLPIQWLVIEKENGVEQTKTNWCARNFGTILVCGRCCTSSPGVAAKDWGLFVSSLVVSS